MSEGRSCHFWIPSAFAENFPIQNFRRFSTVFCAFHVLIRDSSKERKTVKPSKLVNARKISTEPVPAN